jgi:hypothetical protein
LAKELLHICLLGELPKALVGGGILDDDFDLVVHGEDHGLARLLHTLHDLGGLAFEMRRQHF